MLNIANWVSDKVPKVMFFWKFSLIPTFCKKLEGHWIKIGCARFFSGPCPPNGPLILNLVLSILDLEIQCIFLNDMTEEYEHKMYMIEHSGGSITLKTQDIYYLLLQKKQWQVPPEQDSFRFPQNCRFPMFFQFLKVLPKKL